jgi:hypothetical protein
MGEEEYVKEPSYVIIPEVPFGTIVCRDKKIKAKFSTNDAIIEESLLLEAMLTAGAD